MAINVLPLVDAVWGTVWPSCSNEAQEASVQQGASAIEVLKGLDFFSGDQDFFHLIVQPTGRVSEMEAS